MGDAPETKFCSNCKRDIAKSNYVMHEVHCRRHMVLCEHCQEPVARSELDAHYEENHAPKPCTLCGQQFEISKIEQHEEEECPKRPGKCEYCEIQMPRDDLTDHEKYCGTRTEHCPLCQQYIMIKDLERHTSSGCSYPPRKQNAPKNTNRPDRDYDPDILLPDELYNNFAMDEMSRILNSEMAPNVGIPGHLSRELADGAIARSRPSQAAAATDPGGRRKKPAPRQPMQRRQLNTTSISSRSSNTDRNMGKRPNNQQRELAQLQAKPNNLSRATKTTKPSRNSWGNDDLDALLARHLAQDLGSEQADHRHNLLSSEDIDDEFVLPCEFCGEQFPTENLIQHQGMCVVGASNHFSMPSSHSADDILGAAHSPDHGRLLPSRRTFDEDLFTAAQQPTLNNRVHRHRQPSPPPEPEIYNNFSDDFQPGFDDDHTVEGDTMLPCEFCDDLFPGDSLLQHQVVCDANGGDQPAVLDAVPVPRMANPRAAIPISSRHESHQRPVQRLHENSRGVPQYGLDSGGLGSSASSSLIKKDKDNKARQNLITKQANRHSNSLEALGGALSESRIKRRQEIQNGAASSYQPSFGNPVRAAPKLVNKSRRQAQTEDPNLMVAASWSQRTEGTSANGTSRTGTRQAPQTRTTSNKLTNSTRPRRFPQGDV